MARRFELVTFWLKWHDVGTLAVHNTEPRLYLYFQTPFVTAHTPAVGTSQLYIHPGALLYRLTSGFRASFLIAPYHFESVYVHLSLNNWELINNRPRNSLITFFRKTVCHRFTYFSHSQLSWPTRFVVRCPVSWPSVSASSQRLLLKPRPKYYVQTRPYYYYWQHINCTARKIFPDLPNCSFFRYEIRKSKISLMLS